VPIAEQNGRLTVASPNPHNLLALDELELLLGKPLDLVVSTSSAILAALERSEGSSQALRELEAEYRSVLVKEDERGEEILTLDQAGEDQSPADKLLDSIILSAMQRRASDIHIEAADRATKVKLRVDGILVRVSVRDRPPKEARQNRQFVRDCFVARPSAKPPRDELVEHSDVDAVKPLSGELAAEFSQPAPLRHLVSR
jgi:type II secretory ATPase GspE/PulE/Tfp pilus assembly ATPase PilB-like protein